MRKASIIASFLLGLCFFTACSQKSDSKEDGNTVEQESGDKMAGKGSRPVSSPSTTISKITLPTLLRTRKVVFDSVLAKVNPVYADKKESFAKIVEKAQKGEVLTGDDVKEALNVFPMLSHAAEEISVRGETGVLFLFACYQDSKTERTRSLALSYLQDKVPDDVLKRFGKRLMEQLPLTVKTEEFYARLPLRDQRKKELLEKRKMPLKVRARLGDEDAEKELLKAFQSATTFSDKDRLASHLGYVGSAACMKALLSQMSTDLKKEGALGTVSFRLSILRSMMLRHGNEDLFSKKVAYLLRVQDDKRFDRKYGIETFIQEFMEWSKKTYSVTIEMDAAERWFAKADNRPIMPRN